MKGQRHGTGFRRPTSGGKSDGGGMPNIAAVDVGRTARAGRQFIKLWFAARLTDRMRLNQNGRVSRGGGGGITGGHGVELGMRRRARGRSRSGTADKGVGWMGAAGSRTHYVS